MIRGAIAITKEEFEKMDLVELAKKLPFPEAVIRVIGNPTSGVYIMEWSLGENILA